MTETLSILEAALRAQSQRVSVSLGDWCELGELVTALPEPWAQRLPLRVAFGGVIQAWVVAQHLARRLADGDSLASAIAELGRALDLTSTRGCWIRGLVGPQVDQPCELEAGLWIGPASELPQPVNESVLGLEEMMCPASSCLRHEQDIQPVLVSNFENVEIQDPDREHVREIFDDVQHVLVLLVLPTPVTASREHSLFDDATLSSLSRANRVYSVTHRELRRMHVTPQPVDTTDLKELWSKWRGLREGDRNKLRLACDRLNRSLLQGRFVDKCMESCIALEVLLGDGIASGISHTVATRCARRLKSDVVGRTEVARLVKKIYGARSAAAHSGSRKQGVSEVDLAKFTKHVGTLARGMLLEGRVPTPDELDFR
jgi:hypothetical protein